MGQPYCFEVVRKLGCRMAWVLGSLATAFLITALPLTSAAAIPFDRLDDTQIVEDLGGDSTTTSSIKSTSNAIRGTREVNAKVTDGPEDVTTKVGRPIPSSAPRISYSQAAATAGFSTFVYDGNTTLGLQGTGLTAYDITKDAATGFLVRVANFNPGDGTITSVCVTIYDAVTPTTQATGCFSLDTGVVSPTDYLISFSSLIGMASPTKVGAISLTIDGRTDPAADLIVSFLGTNGNCSEFPDAQGRYCADCLGVTNGTTMPGAACNTSESGVCAAGTWTGTAPNCSCKRTIEPSPEQCDELDNNCNGSVDEGFDKGAACTVGVGECSRSGIKICGPGGTVCNATAGSPGTEICDAKDNDCDGQVDEGFDKGASCSVGVGACQRTGVKICALSGSATCSATPGEPSAEVCDGIDNDCDGLVDEGSPLPGSKTDQCGICGGDGKSCLDCKGVVNGTAKVDQCGICGGDGKSCLDCKGVVNGTTRVDQCGVCGGDGKSCLDCKGVPNGTARVDQCGICGGDGKSCLDCKGVVNGTAKVDFCGVCGGDDTSCLACTEQDMTSTLDRLDSGAKEQQLIVRAATTRLRGVSKGNKSEARFITTTLEKAQRLQVRNWVLSWSLPQVSTTCSANPLCVTTSNLDILTEYRQHNDELKQLAYDVIARVRRILKNKVTARDRSILAQADKQHQSNLALSKTVPDVNYACSSKG